MTFGGSLHEANMQNAIAGSASRTLRWPNNDWTWSLAETDS